MAFTVRALLAFALAELPASAQRFEVVSIRPNTVDDINQRFVQGQPGGRMRFVGMPLSTFIMTAYDVWSFQILGGQVGSTPMDGTLLHRQRASRVASQGNN